MTSKLIQPSRTKDVVGSNVNKLTFLLLSLNAIV